MLYYSANRFCTARTVSFVTIERNGDAEIILANTSVNVWTVQLRASNVGTSSVSHSAKPPATSVFSIPLMKDTPYAIRYVIVFSLMRLHSMHRRAGSVLRSAWISQSSLRIGTSLPFCSALCVRVLRVRYRGDDRSREVDRHGLICSRAHTHLTTLSSRILIHIHLERRNLVSPIELSLLYIQPTPTGDQSPFRSRQKYQGSRLPVNRQQPSRPL
jgi:hypothetical protein